MTRKNICVEKIFVWDLICIHVYMCTIKNSIYYVHYVSDLSVTRVTLGAILGVHVCVTCCFLFVSFLDHFSFFSPFLQFFLFLFKKKVLILRNEKDVIFVNLKCSHSFGSFEFIIIYEQKIHRFGFVSHCTHHMNVLRDKFVNNVFPSFWKMFILYYGLATIEHIIVFYSPQVHTADFFSFCIFFGGISSRDFKDNRFTEKMNFCDFA